MNRFYLFFSLVLFFAVPVFSQSYLGYNFVPTEYGFYNEISGGIISTATGNDGAENINLPFQFQYMGVTYTTARISVNGWMEMGQSYTGPGAVNQLESTIEKPFICPLWEDLEADSQSEIRYETVGVYPARYFLVQWKNILLYSYERKSFQIRLWELDGTIDFIYGPGPSQPTYLDYFSVGMNNNIGGSGNFISVTVQDQYNYSVSTTVANNMNNDISLLTSGMLFSFVPTNAGTYASYIYQTPDTVIVGSPDQKIIGIIAACHAGGVLTSPWVTRFDFNTYGTTNTSDILNAKLYTTDEYPHFTTNYQLGPTYPSPNGQFSISNIGYYYLNNNALTYFWLAYDISPNATAGDYVDGNCYWIDMYQCCPGMVPDSSLGNARCIISNMGIQGNYTVGTGEDFDNLGQALNFLESNQLVGQVTLELTDNYVPGDETYPIILQEVSNSSEENTITIKPTTSNEIIFQSNGDHVFHFKNARYFIINGYDQSTGQDKIKIINNSLSGDAVYFTENSSFNIIKNCDLQAADTSTDGAVIKFDELHNELSLQGNQIINCLVSKNGAGNVTNGILIKREFPERSVEDSSISNIIENCTIKDFNFRGVSLVNYLNSVCILNNKIFQTVESTSPIVEGIYSEYGSSGSDPILFQANQIYNLKPKQVNNNLVVGIELPGGFSVKAINNFISLEGNELSTVIGITFASYGYASSLQAYYNSVLIWGINASDSISAAFRRLGATSYTKIKDNLFINLRTNSLPGSKNYCLYFDNHNGLPELDYNNYFYTAGSNNYLAGLENNNVSTLNDWINLTSVDSNSSFDNVSFISNSDLHLTGESLGDTLLIALPIPDIITDIDNELRNPLYPYKGADENLGFPLPVELTSFSAQVTGSDVHLSWNTGSENNDAGFEILRSIQGEMDWNRIGFVPGHGTTIESQNYSFIDKSLQSGNYRYRLRQIDLNGNFEFSQIIEVTILLPSKFSLSQNFPNPFNPVTTIKYSLPVDAEINISVFNMLGMKVKDLINGQKKAGEYEVKFNSLELASGVYFYKITVIPLAGQKQNFTETKKMILLK